MFITEDSNHNLWFGTWFNGLYKISEDRKYYTHFMPDKNNPNSLTSSIIHSGFEDNAGYMWFGTEFTGLNILKKNKRFIVYPNKSKNGKQFPKIVESIGVDNYNRVWLACGAKGLLYFNKRTPEKIINANTIFNFPTNTWVFSLLSDSNDNLWVGTNKGLYKYNFKTKKKEIYKREENNYNSLISNFISSLAEAKNGIIWIGSERGLTQYNPKTNTYYRYTHDKTNPNSLSNNVIRNIFCDSNEDVWIGTFSGLNKFNDKTGDFRVFKQNYNTDKSISANRINTIYELNGCLWIGTEGGGLNQVFLDSQEFISYNKQTKFPSDNIHGITSDQHDNLWISTNTNLIKFNTHTKEYMTYDQSDGLENKDYIDSSVGWQELEFYPNVVCKDINNTLFFGGILGLTFFHPDSLPQNKYKPLIYVNQFLVNSKDYNFNKKVVLNPKQNHIELSILSLNYIQPEKNKYAFFLENYDSVWQNTGNYNRIEYSNLPHGHYKLHYMGSNNDGVWSKETNPIIINVSPFYYQTKWFYFSILLFILFLIFLFFLHKLYIKKKIQKQRKKLRYSQSNLSDKNINTINTQLIEKLNSSTLYLEADLTLNKMASVLGIKTNALSQVINQVHNKNFNTFINQFRLKEAKKLLIETDLKIESIAYDSGFSSLTTFNSFFKKEVGITPSTFRKLNK